MFYSDDPVKDFERYDARLTQMLERLPVCADCGEHIQDEEAFYINDEWLCNDCIDSYKRGVEPYEGF